MLSKAFFAKNWPQYELNGLAARELEGGKVILPIWHSITRQEVLAFSPPLGDKLAITSAGKSIGAIAKELAKVLRPA